jgi:hypothetical protein
LSALLSHSSSFHNQIVESLITFCGGLSELVGKLGPLFECEAIREEVQSYDGSVDWLAMYSDMDRKIAKRKMVNEFGETER